MIEILLTVILLPFAIASVIGMIGLFIGIGRCVKNGSKSKTDSMHRDNAS